VLSSQGVPTAVLEADQTVGGIARIVNYRGYLFDIGGHRFFTKWDAVEELWHEILGDKFLARPRLSRIYYRNRFFYYPLRPKDAPFGLGPVEATRMVASYLWAKALPEGPETNREQWVTHRFSRRP
jgi:protoporphyrinogen oxidase